MTSDSGPVEDERATCRNYGCQKAARGSDAMDAHAGRFCSPHCEVTYDHARDDARQARLDAQAEESP